VPNPCRSRNIAQNSPLAECRDQFAALMQQPVDWADRPKGSGFVVTVDEWDKALSDLRAGVRPRCLTSVCKNPRKTAALSDLSILAELFWKFARS
jgi:hypothetical protein